MARHLVNANIHTTYIHISAIAHIIKEVSLQFNGLSVKKYSGDPKSEHLNTDRFKSPIFYGTYTIRAILSEHIPKLNFFILILSGVQNLNHLSPQQLSTFPKLNMISFWILTVQ